MGMRVWYISLDNSEQKHLQRLSTLMKMDFFIGVCALPILCGPESVM